MRLVKLPHGPLSSMGGLPFCLTLGHALNGGNLV
jgi:hypothetical protein